LRFNPNAETFAEFLSKEEKIRLDINATGAGVVENRHKAMCFIEAMPEKFAPVICAWYNSNLEDRTAEKLVEMLGAENERLEKRGKTQMTNYKAAKKINSATKNKEKGSTTRSSKQKSKRLRKRRNKNGKCAEGTDRKAAEGGESKKDERGEKNDKSRPYYKNGDIIGGLAPELGVENKGRAMLEKMGWSHGTALGAENNKGILQPVTAVVKTGKSGLG
jgi:hypothetical protein